MGSNAPVDQYLRIPNHFWKFSLAAEGAINELIVIGIRLNQLEKIRPNTYRINSELLSRNSDGDTTLGECGKCFRLPVTRNESSRVSDIS